MDERPLKICLAASAGGHLTQLLRLEEAWRGHDVFFVTTGNMVAAQLGERFDARAYVVGESNRQHPLRMLRVLARCVGVIVRERPDVVVSTGAAHGALLCCLGKLVGARIVWVDSIANVHRPSLSGRIVLRLSDLFLAQWRDVAEGDPRIEYLGELV